MRTLGIIAVTAGLLTVIACSAADPAGDKTDPVPTTTEKHSNNDNAAPEAPAPAPVTPPATPPTPVPHTDAGVDAAPPPVVTTHFCADLGACCNTLSSTVEKFACIGIQLAGKEIACEGEAALCGSGGIGGTPCGNLETCCNQMLSEGYDGDAQDCRGHDNGNKNECSGWLQQYEGMGWCD